MKRLAQIAWIVLILSIASAGSIAMLTGTIKDAELFGVESAASHPVFSISNVVHESFQAAAVAWFEQNWGLRGYAVRTDNTLIDTVFGETRKGQSVYLANRGVFIKDEDVTYYNRTDSPTAAIAAAMRFANAQAAMKKRGVVLLPVIVPSKTSFFRQELPAGLRRQGGEAVSDRNLYGAFVETLKENHALFVDARAALTAESDASFESRLEIFPRTARHWSTGAACHVMQLIADAVRGSFPGMGSAQVDCTMVRKEHPGLGEEEFDLFRIANVWWNLPTDVPVNEVVGRPGGAAFQIPTLFVGSSFLWKVVRISHDLEVFRPSLFYYYDKTIFETEHETIIGKVQPYTEGWRSDTWSKKLFIVDVLETYLPAQGLDFLDEIEKDADVSQP